MYETVNLLVTWRSVTAVGLGNSATAPVMNDSEDPALASWSFTSAVSRYERRVTVVLPLASITAPCCVSNEAESDVFAAMSPGSVPVCGLLSEMKP